MLSVLQPVKGLAKPSSLSTSNFVFRLHYQISSLIFLSASLIMLSDQLFGVPIDCFTEGSDSREEAFKKTIDNICWVTSLFTVKEHLCGVKGRDVIHQGVGTFFPNQHTIFDIHVTYRFIFFGLLLQALFFYLPHFLHKSWESGKMKMLSEGLRNPLIDEKDKSSRISLLAYYLQQGHSNGSLKSVFRLHFCEILNFILVGVNVWATDLLFDNEFIGYGFKMLGEKGAFYDAGCDDMIKSYFPQMAKCDFQHFGPSGNIIKRDVVCLLPVNDFNVVFFKFIWFWYALLLLASLVWLLFRVVSIYSIKVRTWLLSRRVGTPFEYITKFHIHEKHDNCCTQVCENMSYSDWVTIMQLGSNVDPLLYKQLIETLCQEIQRKQFTDEKALDRSKFGYSV